MNVLDALRRAMKSGVQTDIEAALKTVQTAMDAKDDEHHAEGHQVHIHVGGVGENAAGKEEPPPKKEDPMDEAPPWFKAHHEDRAKRDAKFDKEWEEMKGWRSHVDAFMHHGKELPMTEHDNKEIEGELEEEAPPGTAFDVIKGAKDSAILVDSFQATCAGAEVLAPGITLPRLDRNASPRATFNVICGLRRAALDAALSKPDTRDLVLRAAGGRTIDTKTARCSDVRNVFRTAVLVRQAGNVSDNRAVPGPTPDYGPVGGIESPAQLNHMYAKHFADLRPAQQNNGYRR